LHTTTRHRGRGKPVRGGEAAELREHQGPRPLSRSGGIGFLWGGEPGAAGPSQTGLPSWGEGGRGGEICRFDPGTHAPPSATCLQYTHGRATYFHACVWVQWGPVTPNPRPAVSFERGSGGATQRGAHAEVAPSQTPPRTTPPKRGPPWGSRARCSSRSSKLANKRLEYVRSGGFGPGVAVLCVLLRACQVASGRLCVSGSDVSESTKDSALTGATGGIDPAQGTKRLQGRAGGGTCIGSYRSPRAPRAAPSLPVWRHWPWGGE
jgi:hypothetical protein